MAENKKLKKATQTPDVENNATAKCECVCTCNATEEIKIPAPKLQINGNALTLTAGIKLDDIKKIQKYEPEALVVKEYIGPQEEAEKFRVALGKSDICEYGISFESANKDGYATATVMIPQNVTDKVKYVKESKSICKAIYALRQLQYRIVNVASSIDDVQSSIESMIEEA